MTEPSRRLPPWAANLLLADASLLFLFAVLEIGVRWLVDLKEFKPTGVYDVDPENPIRFLPGHERVYETRAFRYKVSFNRFGRRDDEWSEAALDDPENVLFIGDSFVLGNGVEHEDAIPTLLEPRLGGREVFNFGMPAGGPRTYLRLFEHALDSGLAAETVVIGTFVGNDFHPSVLGEETLVAEQSPKARRREREMACLDLLPVLSERYARDGEPLYFPIDRHLNERGTAVAADAIAGFLQETGALR